jgi:type I restriction enzyme S subunit
MSFASYLVRFRVHPYVDPEYACLLLNRPETLARARTLALPAIGQANLNPNRYGYLPVCLPPLDEQQAIVRQVRRVKQHADETRKAVSEAIARLREYRSALITAAVVGKIDVRKCRAEE